VPDPIGAPHKALETFGAGTPVNFHTSEYPKLDGVDQWAFSKKFQWLPSDFAVSAEGDVRVESYINNVHPVKNEGFYRVVEKIFKEFIPLFEATLQHSDKTLEQKIPSRTEVDMGGLREDAEPDEDEEDEEDEDWEMGPITNGPSIVGFDAFKEKYDEALGTVDNLPATVKLAGRQLQVIVKAANIVLGPDKPEYEGGSWHVEGMANEAIAATGIYYYEVENVTESKLLFRTAVEECDYEQNDDAGVQFVYGLENERPLNQPLGHIVVRKGRCIAFPNIYQHKVERFKLADTDKPGFRKILVFFLVDPSFQTLSTARVPPQQHSWYEEILSDQVFSKLLPKDVADKVSERCANEFTFTLEEAKKIRDELIEERKARSQPRVSGSNARISKKDAQ